MKRAASSRWDFGDNIDLIPITLHQKKIRFEYPASGYMKNLILSIFSGEDYPVIQFPGFSPSVIVDIGANVGATALYFHAAFPNALIYCYEPSLRNYRFLETNTRHFDKIRSYPYGLFNRKCHVPLYLGKDQPAQDSVVINSETTGREATAKLVKISEEINNQGIECISILKMDTEGCELPILGELLTGPKSYIPIDLIYLEYHSEEDRLELDRMLADRFLLLYARTGCLHRGTNAYISKDIITALPGLEQLRIEQRDDNLPFP